jgi:hypothetical protein
LGPVVGQRDADSTVDWVELLISEEVLELGPGGGVLATSSLLAFPRVCRGPLDILEGVVDLGAVVVVLTRPDPEDELAGTNELVVLSLVASRVFRWVFHNAAGVVASGTFGLEVGVFLGGGPGMTTIVWGVPLGVLGCVVARVDPILGCLDIAAKQSHTAKLLCPSKSGSQLRFLTIEVFVGFRGGHGGQGLSILRIVVVGRVSHARALTGSIASSRACH